MSWSVLKSVYDHALGKEIDIGDHVKFGRVCFWVRETSESVKREQNDSEGILNSREIFDNTNTDFDKREQNSL